MRSLLQVSTFLCILCSLPMAHAGLFSKCMNLVYGFDDSPIKAGADDGFYTVYNREIAYAVQADISTVNYEGQPELMALADGFVVARAPLRYGRPAFRAVFEAQRRQPNPLQVEGGPWIERVSNGIKKEDILAAAAELGLNLDPSAIQTRRVTARARLGFPGEVKYHVIYGLDKPQSLALVRQVYANSKKQ